MIYDELLSSPLQQLENITIYGSKSKQTAGLDLLGQKRTDNNRKGDYWELFVALEAIERGAEVFKNVSCVGSVDMVLEIEGTMYPINVKAMVERNKQSPGKYYQETLNVIPEDVYMVNVHPVTKEICWHTKRIPEGLKDYWK